MATSSSILITTRNRCDELRFTLQKISVLKDNDKLEVVVCDDASEDGTAPMVAREFPNIVLLANSNPKGYIHNRNLMLRETTAQYAMSLDDDAHLLTEDIFNTAENYFKENPNCGLIACRIYWGKQLPDTTTHKDGQERVQGYVGCGHIWNMKAWRDIPDYPEWFVFYGEEQFAAFQLFKKGWEVHYVPDILVQHRVEVKARKKDKDYSLRLRRSLRSGWYLYLLFYPWREIPKGFVYTLWMQLKLKVFKGDLRAGWAIARALCDVVYNLPRLIKNSNRLTPEEFKEFNTLPETKIYWTPKN